MTPRLAVHLSTHQLPELQRAARAMLRRPLITAASDVDFRLVRKWETVLRNEFGQKLGYRLDVSRSSARLLRRPVTVSRHRGARLDTGRQLPRWAYVYMCLVLAAIEQPGNQVLASELVTRIEQGARGDNRLRIDSTEYAQRRGFRDAVRFLEKQGVLTVRDGDVERLLADGQVLFDIDRDTAAMCMVASPSILREVTTIDDFVSEPTPTSMDARRRLARQRLNRRMLDQPVVMLVDLDDDETELAWRNRRREADNISRLTGCAIELRREGLALVEHPTDPIGDRRFPGGDGVAHAALLWLDGLVEASEDYELDEIDEIDEGDGAPALDGSSSARAGLFRHIDEERVESCWRSVVADYGHRFGKASIERPDRFRSGCAELLERFGLARITHEGMEISAFANRFRATATFVDRGARESDGDAHVGDGRGRIEQTALF
jgi:uncharacterized protein (TIGR02678 family)